MKKIFTLIASLMMVLSMSAATKTIYCKMAHDWWYADGAVVGAHYWGTADGGTSWPGNRMTPVTGETNLWSVDIDTDKYQNIIFTRVNGSGTVSDWGAKTADLIIPTDGKNMYTITSTDPVWGNPGVTGNWSTYTPNAPKTYKDITFTITANAAPQIHYWDGGDKMVGSDWENLPTMTATGNVNEYTYTVKDVDEAKGVKYLLKIGNIQTSDQITSENVIADFKNLMPEVYVKGVTGWTGDGHKMTIADDCVSASVTITLAANLTADLKLTIGGTWMGDAKNAITKENNSSVFDTNGSQNGSIKTDIAGDYVFTYTYADQTLTVTYPTEEIEVAVDCYVTGNTALTGEDWVLNSENLKMTKVEGTEKYTYTFTALPANTAFELKVVYAGTQKGFSSLSEAIDGVTANGDNICFTLEETGDVTVTYDAETEKIALTGNFAIPVTYDYYIVGSFNGDNPKKAENGMTLDGAVYKATVTLAEGDNTLKVTDGSWDNTWGYSNLGAAYDEVSDANDYNNIKITLAAEAEKNITVIFDATAGKITFEGLTEKVIEYGVTFNVTVPEGTEACYICGEWDWTTFKPMTKVDDTHYTLEIAEATKDHGYKYTCGEGWEFVEKDAEGNDLAGDRTWSENDVVASWAAPAEPVEMASVVLLGVEGDWTTGIEMELNPTDANEYMLLCQSITADEPIKIKAVDTQATVTWCAKLADTSLGTVVKDADGNDNIVLEEGKYDFYYKVAENEVWIGTCTETEPEYNVVEDEITNFVFDTEAWPMVCMGGPSTTYEVEVFLTLTEDADGTLAYEDCSVSIMGTDATFIDGTLSNIDVYAPSADAVLHVLWQEEYYELKLSMSAVSSAAPVDVMAADATVTFSDNEGALKFNGTNVYDDDAVYVELAGFEYNGAGEYTLNGAQISMFENTDAFAFADEVTVAIDEDGYVTVEGVYTSFNGGGIYNVRIWGALPKYTLTLSSDVSDATLTGSDTYYATQEVTVTATQELPGWVFDHWSDGDEKVSTDATYTFRIGKDLELTANYLEIYTRTVTSGSYGTICLPNGSVKVEGAKFYEVTFKKDGYIYADEVTELAAGMPYIFQATSTEIKVYYNETPAAATAGSKNGVYGTFSDITDGDAGTTGNVLEGKYLLVAGPKVQKCAGNCSLAANRAYFVVSEITTNETQPLPGRKRIALGCQEENQATGLDNITENGIVAPAMQGTYDILGRQLSEPAANGFYIINGKKMFVVK